MNALKRKNILAFYFYLLSSQTQHRIFSFKSILLTHSSKFMFQLSLVSISSLEYLLHQIKGFSYLVLYPFSLRVIYLKENGVHRKKHSWSLQFVKFFLWKLGCDFSTLLLDFLICLGCSFLTHCFHINIHRCVKSHEVPIFVCVYEYIQMLRCILRGCWLMTCPNVKHLLTTLLYLSIDCTKKNTSVCLYLNIYICAYMYISVWFSTIFLFTLKLLQVFVVIINAYMSVEFWYGIRMHIYTYIWYICMCARLYNSLKGTHLLQVIEVTFTQFTFIYAS